MKQIFFIVFFLISFIGFGQIYQGATLYGKNENRLDVIRSLGIPLDTFAIDVNHRNKPHIAVVSDSLVYIWSVALQRWKISSIIGTTPGGGGAVTWGDILGDIAGNPQLVDSFFAKQNRLPIGSNQQMWSANGELQNGNTFIKKFTDTAYLRPEDTINLSYRIDTINARNQTFSTLNYTNGLVKVGQDVIAQYDDAIWNAGKIQGKPVIATVPTNGQTLIFNTANDRWELGASGGEGEGLTVDAVPTNGSSNPVSSNGVYDNLILKLNITDTGAMLTPYLRSNIAAATYAPISGLALKLNISDTASMLTNYKHWLQGYLKAADIAGKLNVSDTASMLANYRHWTQGYLKAIDIVGKLNISDTTSMLSNYLRANVAAATYQPILGFTPENVANKATSLASPNNTTYPTTLAVVDAMASIGAPSGDTYMLKSTYDINGNNKADDADAVGGSTLANILARTNHTGTQAISTVTGLQAALDDKQQLNANLTGISGLSGNGLLRKTAGTWGMDATTYLTNADLTPYETVSGAASKYVPLTRSISINGTTQDLSANRTWTLTTANVTESGNLYFTTNRVLATPLTGYTLGTNTAISASDELLAALGKIQAQINARLTSGDLSPYLTSATAATTYQTLGNLSTSTSLGTSNTLYPSQNAVKVYVDNAMAAAGSYNDEQAQDAVGAMVSSEFTYTDATPSLTINQIAASKITESPARRFVSDAEKATWNGKEDALGNPATNGYVLSSTTAGVRSWIPAATGTGTVTSTSVASANGFAGSVANASTTPTITLSTTVTGMLKGNGTAISGAVAGTDYVAPNAAITGATGIKITYDSKGLVTGSTSATTTDIAEGTNLYYTDARTRAAALTGLSTATATAVTATDNVLTGIGKLQGQINALPSTSNFLVKTNNLSDLSSASTARTNLGATTVGSNLFTLTNPSAITFPRINADNTVSTLSASDFRAAIGAGTGSGTVTSVSVTTANGVSGSVATNTTTPSITLSLGAITPSSVAASGTITGSNLSGTNTGDQFTNTTSQRLLGRYAGTAGAAQEISIGTGLSLNSTTGVLTASGGTNLSGTGYVKMSGTTPSYNATIPNADLTNSSISIAGNSTALGGSVTQDAITGLSSTGLVKRTGSNALAIAAAGTDYLTPTGNGSGLTGLTKSQVGLSNVDNTSDANKPVSTAQQAALDLKVPTARTITINGTSQDLSSNRSWTISTAPATPTVQTLTDGSTVTMDYATSPFATITLGGNRTLSITGLPGGDTAVSGIIRVKQDATGGRTLSLPGVLPTGFALSNNSNGEDLLGFTRIGSNIYWSVEHYGTVNVTSGGSSGGSYDSDAEAFFDAAGITNTAQKDALNTAVVALKGYGLWTSAKALYPFVGGDATKHSYNLRNPGAFQVTWNGPTHSASGVTFDGVNDYGNTNLTPLTHLPASTQTIGVHNRTASIGANRAFIGSFSGLSYTLVGTEATATQLTGEVSNDAFAIGSVSGDYSGTLAVSRTTSILVNVYKNGVSVASSTDAENGSTNAPIFIGCYNVGGSPSGVIAGTLDFAFIYESTLTATQLANLHSVITQLNTDLGR